MELVLKLDDVEIENLHPGPIIHIFPKNDPYTAMEEILQGLHLLDDIKLVLDEMDAFIKKEEQPEYILMAFAELKRLLKKSLIEGERYSLEFMEKKKFDPKS